jgi:nicastrin
MITGHIPYHSHRDSASIVAMSLNSIAAAATLVARAAVAAAYDDGSNDNGGYANAAKYAKNIIPELNYNDGDLVELSNCLFYGSCNILQKYSDVETANEKIRTGLNIGSGDPFPNPPSFFVGVYNSYYGQPFVQVGDNAYGAYNGNDFGKKNSDAISMMPRQLENAVHGIFNDYLGRGSNANNNNAVSCKKSSDCSSQQNNMCNNGANGGDYVTCSGGGQCVCKRAYFHIAVDESLDASPNYPTGYFQFNDYNNNEQSALYTEPFWSSNVGIRVYRDSSSIPGFITFGIGIVMGAISMFSAFVLKVGLKKEKLY